MSLRALFLRTYVRRFKAPVYVKGQELVVRKGLWLEAEGVDGQVWRAECAPLPAWHEESLEECERVFREEAFSLARSWNLPSDWNWEQAYFGIWEPSKALAVSLQSSIESLLLQSQCGRLSRQLMPSIPMQLAGLVRPGLEGSKSFESLWQEGYRTFKVKVGQGRVLEELEWLENLSEKKQKKGLKLRLDANQSHVSELLADRERIKALPIEYWEEPDVSSWPLLRDLGANIACDEALRGLDPDRDPWPSAQVLVLKPNQLGMQRFLRWMELAPRRARQVVLSNCYESEPTLAFYAWLYGMKTAEPLALGFGTLASFAESWMDPLLPAWTAEGPWPTRPSAGLSWPEFVSSRSLVWTS